MNKLFHLISCSLKQATTPESLLNLTPPAPLPKTCKLIPPFSCFMDALYKRFPELLKRSVLLLGQESADLLATLYSDCTQNCIQENEPITSAAYTSFIRLHEAGLSISWWLFGLAPPMQNAPKILEWHNLEDLQDYMRNLRYLQGWSDLETKWFMTQTHERSENKMIQKVLMHTMAGLPTIKLFPPMPEVMDVYRRLEKAVEQFVPEATSPPWLKSSIQQLQNSSWRICVLLLVRQSSISHWQNIQLRPRRKSVRLAFVLNLLFDLYGENVGLTYYLKILNHAACNAGFNDLSEVIQEGVWHHP